MHVTVVAAGAKTTKAAIQFLLNSPQAPTVRGVYRDPSKAPESFTANPRFTAVKGDVSDASSLDFSGSDAVVAITPSGAAEKDVVVYAREVSVNTRKAIEAAGSVKRLVLLSSGGAQYSEGVGEIKTNHEAETVFRGAAPEVVFVRPGYFMENWATELRTLLTDDPHIVSTITPADFKFPMIAVEDVGRALADEVLATGQPLPSNPYAFDLYGPRTYSPLDVQKAFSEVLGKHVGLKLIEKDDLDGFYAQIFPPGLAKEFTEMTKSFLPGGLIHRDPNPTGVVRSGEVELTDALKNLLPRA